MSSGSETCVDVSDWLESGIGRHIDVFRTVRTSSPGIEQALEPMPALTRMTTVEENLAFVHSGAVAKEVARGRQA